KKQKSKTSFTGAFDFLVQKGLMGQPHIYSPTTNKTTDPINLGLWLFFAFFRGEKRADYLKKGKRLWKI
ncbi:hypothetical protein P7381_14150, partial [Staphylococcus aureus]|nr:hypothetical protein [Staphylococcus aureus]